MYTENLKQLVAKRRFWYGLQLFFILLLCLMGWSRGELSLTSLVKDPVERVFDILLVVLGMPSGLAYFFFSESLSASASLLLAAGYYAFFVGVVERIAKTKNIGRIGFVLLLLMILSFAGCAKAVNLPYIDA